MSMYDKNHYNIISLQLIKINEKKKEIIKLESDLDYSNVMKDKKKYQNQMQ